MFDYDEDESVPATDRTIELEVDDEDLYAR